MQNSRLDFFDRVVVLNLARRSDRWQSFQRELPRDWPFRMPERVPSIDGTAVRCPQYWTGGGGAWGCYRSHLRLLEESISSGVSSLLVLEDDAVCCDDFPSAVDTFLEHLPADWWWIYLGGQHIESGRAAPVRVNDYVYRPFNVNRTHAYALRGQEAMRRLYYHLLDPHDWSGKHHVDHRMGELHMNLIPGVYVPHHWLISQRSSVSDVNGNEHQESDFPAAEVLAAKEVTAPMIAVLGPRTAAVGRLVQILRELGVNMGELATDENCLSSPEAPELKQICGNIFGEPHYVRQQSAVDGIRQLRAWATKRCYAARRGRRIAGGYHPALCLLGTELQEAWDEPLFIVVESVESATLDQRKNSEETDDERVTDAAKEYATRLLTEERENFLRACRPCHLRVRADHILHQPKEVRAEIARFLDDQGLSTASAGRVA